MTDKELWQAAWKELTLTTDSYPAWKKKGFPASSHWAKAKSLGDQIGPDVPPVSTNPVPPPPSGCYFGAYIEGVATYGHYYPAQTPWSNAPLQDPGTTDSWDKFEVNAGKKVAMLMFGQSDPTNGGTFQAVYMDACVARGAIPVVDMMTFSTPLTDIAAGKYDAQITAYAQAAKAWGKPFVLRLDCEMNGSWYSYGAQARTNPASFVQAWRKFHDLFASAGATNVSWHWCPNIDPESVQTPLEQLWPGDAYVDWAGFTGYSHDAAEQFDWLFRSTYDRVKALTGKPMMIGEIASVVESRQPFLTDLFAKLPVSYPNVKALCWFNWWILENGKRWTWPIEEGLSQFKAGIANPYWVGRP